MVMHVDQVRLAGACDQRVADGSIAPAPAAAIVPRKRLRDGA
jgi:hypothetical protein